MAQRVLLRFKPKQSVPYYVRYERLKAKHDFMCKPSTCHFQFAHRHYLSAIFHTVNIILCKKNTEKYISGCISILSLRSTDRPARSQSLYRLSLPAHELHR
jgi:hypothetical protein